MALAVALLVAALAITPHTFDKPQQRRASVALPRETTSPALVAAAVPDAALSWRTTLAVGMALCNDVLLLLMLVPMLPHLLPAGSSALALSFVFSAKDAAQLLLAPLAGALTLRFGARRTLAASLFAVAAATVAFAEARGLRALLAARALQGAASAALMSGGLTLVAETHPPAERASAIARAQAGLGVGAAIGPVFGGLMLEAAGRRGAFYSASALVLLNGVAVIAVGRGDPQSARRSDPAAERRPAAPAARQLLSLLGNRAIATVALGIFAEYAAGGCYDVTFGIHLSETFGVGAAGASLAFALEPITYLVALLLLSRAVDRGGPRRKPRFAAAGLALTALSLPMLSLGGRRSSVAASLLLHGVGYAFKDASTHGLLADLVDAHGAEGSYAMAFALADVADSAGYIVGPPLGAALGAALGSRTKGLALSGLGVLAAVPATLALGA